MLRAWKWKRFTVRSLLIAVTIFAIPLGWMATRIQTARRQQTATAKLESAGATVMDYHFTVGQNGQLVADREFPRVSAFRAVLGDDFFSDVVEVNASHTEISGSDLVALSCFPKLEYLFLDGLKIGDSDLDNLAACRGLTRLTLNGTAVSDRGMHVIGTLTNLKILELSNTKVSDNGLVYLKGLTQLEQLVLDNCRIRGPGLKYLRGLQRLEWLNLSDTDIKDEFLESIYKLSSLKKVFLINTPITNNAVDALHDSIPEADIWEPDWEYGR